MQLTLTKQPGELLFASEVNQIVAGVNSADSAADAAAAAASNAASAAGNALSTANNAAIVAGNALSAAAGKASIPDVQDYLTSNPPQVSPQQVAGSVADYLTAHPPTASGYDVLNARNAGLSGSGNETTTLNSIFANNPAKKIVLENIQATISANSSLYQALLIQGDNRRIQGDNASIRVIPSGSTYSTNHPSVAIYVNGNNIEFDHIDFDFSAIPGTPTNYMGGVQCQNVTGLSFNKCKFLSGTDAYGGGGSIGTVNCFKVRITNCDFSYGDSHIYLLGLGDTYYIAHCTFEDGNSEAIVLANSDNTAAVGSVPTDWLIHDIVIKRKRNSFGLNLCNGWHGHAHNIQISDCLGGVMFNDSQTGLRYDQYSKFLNVHDVTIRNTLYGMNNVGTGMNIHHCEFDHVARQSILTNFYRTQASAEPDPANFSNAVYIDDNRFYQCGGDSQQRPIVYLYNINDGTFNNNKSFGNSSSDYYGILVQGCSNMDILGNKMPDTSFTAAYGTDFSKRMVINSTFKDYSLNNSGNAKQNLPVQDVGGWRIRDPYNAPAS